jgi:hypothetical protein
MLVKIASALMLSLSLLGCGGGGSADPQQPVQVVAAPSIPTPQTTLPDIAGNWVLAEPIAVLPQYAAFAPTVSSFSIAADGTFDLRTDGYLIGPFGGTVDVAKKFLCKITGKFEVQPAYDTRLHGRNVLIEDLGGEIPCAYLSPTIFTPIIVGEMLQDGHIKMALGDRSSYDLQTTWIKKNPDGTSTANLTFTVKR